MNLAFLCLQDCRLEKAITRPDRLAAHVSPCHSRLQANNRMTESCSIIQKYFLHMENSQDRGNASLALLAVSVEEMGLGVGLPDPHWDRVPRPLIIV